ncbi:putative XS domain-containing protein [Helianthus anomalus]
MEHVLFEYDKKRENKGRYENFFKTCDSLTVDQINEPTRKWHCPAFQGGRGAIRSYCSLQALLAHVKSTGGEKARTHRSLAKMMEDYNMRLKGAIINPAGKSYGQWKGLNEVVKDREIVWPPMVVKDREIVWPPMSYGAVRGRHCYGPEGHMGISVLIFESSAVGYMKAERLKKHFEDEGTDRTAWDLNPVLLDADGKRKLYGYMATKEDMNIFNKHSKGKSKLTFELVSYQKKVVDHQKADKALDRFDLVAEKSRQKDRHH